MNRIFFGILLVVFPLVGCSQSDEQVGPTTISKAPNDTVAVLGTGDMGNSFGPRLAALGYRVVYGSRNPTSDKVLALLEVTGHDASAATQKEAAQQADIVLLALPWPAMETIMQNLGDLDGKVLIDMSVPPTDHADDGYLEITIETSSAEMIQGWNPRAMVVKAFGTLGSNIVDDPLVAGGPVSVPIASDHRIAKEKTALIASELGLDPVDAGPLRMARVLESMALLYLIPIYQERATQWEFYFRRSNFWVCTNYVPDGEIVEPEYPPLLDAGNMADIPHTQGLPEPCP